MGDGPPDAHVVEGGLIVPQVDRLGHQGQPIQVAQVRMALLERLQVLLAHVPVGLWPASICPVRYIASPVEGSSRTSHSTPSTHGRSLRKYSGLRLKTVLTFG